MDVAGWLAGWLAVSPPFTVMIIKESSISCTSSDQFFRRRWTRDGIGVCRMSRDYKAVM